MIFLKSKRGYTLLELLIAMSAGAAVLATISFLWISITRSTSRLQTKSILTTETHRIGALFINELRHSSAVLECTPSNIRFVSGDGIDTVSYSFQYDSLFRNGRALHSPFPGFSINQCELQRSSDSKYLGTNDQFPSELLTIFIVGTLKRIPPLYDTLIAQARIRMVVPHS